jgi:thioredoxin-like negative regulator of GroEL
MSDQNFYSKYLKYKTKYFNLKNSANLIQSGGAKNTEKPTIYLFKAEWCGHCKGFKDTWAKISQDLSSKYNFVTVDSDKDKDLIAKWKIEGFPTIIKQTGDRAQEYVGPRDEQSVVEFIQAN